MDGVSIILGYPVVHAKRRAIEMKNNQLEGTKGISPEEDLFDFSYYNISMMKRTITRYKLA